MLELGGGELYFVGTGDWGLGLGGKGRRENGGDGDGSLERCAVVVFLAETHPTNQQAREAFARLGSAWRLGMRRRDDGDSSVNTP